MMYSYRTKVYCIVTSREDSVIHSLQRVLWAENQAKKGRFLSKVNIYIYRCVSVYTHSHARACMHTYIHAPLALKHAVCELRWSHQNTYE